jgi:hypothetical protein
LIFLRSTKKNPQVMANPEFYQRGVWSPNGKLFAMCPGHSVIILDQEGQKISDVPAQDIRRICWIDDETLWGLTSGFAYSGSLIRVRMPNSCETIHRWEKGPSYDARFLPLGPQGDILIGERGNFRNQLTPKGEFLPIEYNLPLANIRGVSPSGRYRVANGPQSYREGVTLLKIIDMADKDLEHPLVRFYGGPFGAMLWSPDETRVAFLARRDDGSAMLLSFRIGDRHAAAVSMPNQEPSCFAWFMPSMVKLLETHWDHIEMPTAS